VSLLRRSSVNYSPLSRTDAPKGSWLMNWASTNRVVALVKIHILYIVSIWLLGARKLILIKATTIRG
jgi:hypothetical protein